MNDAQPTISTNGGAYVGKDVTTGGGDAVMRDQYKFEIKAEGDVSKVIADILAALPKDSLLGKKLLRLMEQFETHHNHLNELKELHDYLHDLLNSVQAFYSQVRDPKRRFSERELRYLASQWRNVEDRIDALMNWARNLKYIAAPDPPFAKTNGQVIGPAWAVQIYSLKLDIHAIIVSQAIRRSDLEDSTSELNNVILRHMFEVDKKLRKIAEAIYILSREVRASI